MSRIKKTLLNAKIGIIFYAISLFTHFFSRKIFLEVLGDDFVGLTTTLQGILGFLNLAELGIGTAIGVTLYKPLFNNDKDEINKVISLIGYLYKKIGFGILVLGLILCAFIPLIFESAEFDLITIFFIFFTFLTTSLLTYFITYHIVLLQADQRSYVVSTYFQSFAVLKLISQCLLVYYYQSYYLWIIMELIFPIVTSILLKIKIQKTYPWLNANNKLNNSSLTDYPEVIKLIKQTFIHKIGSFMLGGTDQLLIFALVNLKSVAFFGNYQIIFLKLTELANTLFSGIGAGVGNLVAENNEENIKKIFWEMMALRFFIGGFICICLYYLIEPFIMLWLGSKYILNQWILILMLANFFMSQIRTPVENFKSAYALFWDVWAPITEVILNLITSLIFGMMWGIEGIMLGSVISVLFIALIWKPYFLYKYGFKKNVYGYWKGFLILVLLTMISIPTIGQLVNLFCKDSINNYLDWLILAIKLCFIILVVYVPLLCFTKGFKDLLIRAFKLIK